MKRQLRKVLLVVMVVLSLATVAGQIVSAGTPIRCGSACADAGRVYATPTPGP